MQLRPEATIILQFLSCLGDVTSWNIRLYLNDKSLSHARETAKLIEHTRYSFSLIVLVKGELHAKYILLSYKELSKC